MSSADPQWQTHLPPYGRPLGEAQETPPRPPAAPARRRPMGTWALALALSATLAAVAVVVAQDPRSVGTQLDDTVAAVRGTGDQLYQVASGSTQAAADASRQALDGASTALDDSAISFKVKAALAADPALSAARIEVSTRQGIVRLDGPAPDARARDRATVLAGAPHGVRGVDNRLALPQPGQVIDVAQGVPAGAEAPR